MSDATPPRERPLSPFMLGPYYRPQLTSMLSITHRATGMFLALGAFVLMGWLVALAGGPGSYASYVECLAGPFGWVLGAGLVFSLAFHFFNGIRHLLWDVGWGLEIPRTYATGYAVIVLALLATALILLRVIRGLAVSALRHPLARARGLGSAKEGSGHWIAQRLTAVALVPLAIWFIVAATGPLSDGYADARTYLAQPWNASLAAVFVFCLFYHAQLGIQVVIEDYIHARWLEVALELLNKFACFFAAVASLIAIVRIALGA